MSENVETVHGCANVFRDFGYPDADIRQAKSLLAARIVGILDDRALSTRKAEKLTGFAAADFSRIRNADYGRFTLDRLIRILNALDATLEITVDVHPRTAA
jgi:predicted XRE-type DNA-binding protein